MASDRIFGLVVAVGALAFFVSALNIQSSFLTDPVGPRVFPAVIAGAAFLCGLAMMWKPDAEPQWPDAKGWIGIALATVLLVAYAYALAPLGFLIPTAIASAGISYLIMPRVIHAAATGAGLAALLFIIFKYGLGLGLVALPRALVG
jgi:putative tricarboxylic transport membrane protein